MTERHLVSVGVDLGGTSTRVGLYDRSMILLASASIPTRVSAGPQSCTEEIADLISVLCLQAGIVQTSQILGIGIGSPGPMDLRTGVLGLLPNLPGWDNFPLRSALAEATGLPVILESDANAAAIAEWKLGSGQASHFDSMAMFTLGTGVGSGIILDGKVWHGRSGMGGEVGHATVQPQGLSCGCGTRGCLEMYASANALMRLAVEAAQESDSSSALRNLVERPEGFTPLDVALLADSDSTVQSIFDRFGQYLGIGIANLINTLDLPLIVVGGGVASSWKLFSPALFRTVRDYSVVYRLASPSQMTTYEEDRIFICPATLGPAAGLLGAALLPMLNAEKIAEAQLILTAAMASQ